MTRESVHKTAVIVGLTLFSGAYVYLSFTTPPQPTVPGFELYEPWKTLIRITLLLPILLSWVFGAFAVMNLLSAAHRAPPGTQAERMFHHLGNGVLALAMGSWVATLIGQIKTNFIPKDSFLDISSTVALNYTYVIFPLVGFALIYAASRSRTETQEDERNQSWPAALLLVAILGALWLAIIFTNASRQVTSFAYGRPSFYISDALIILTIVTPTLVAWLLGIGGALNFSALESGGAPATRKAFTRIVHGLLFAVFYSIILNGLLSAGSERLMAGGLAFLLVIVYVFVLMATFSYWMIWRGAKSLLEGSYEHQE